MLNFKVEVDIRVTGSASRMKTTAMLSVPVPRLRRMPVAPKSKQQNICQCQCPLALASLL
jgi:hypothetical protein